MFFKMSQISSVEITSPEVKAKLFINVITIAGSPIQSPPTILPLERFHQFQMAPEGKTKILATHIYTAAFTYKKERKSDLRRTKHADYYPRFQKRRKTSLSKSKPQKDALPEKVLPIDGL